MELAPAGRNRLPATKVLAATGEGAKEFQVMDSPLRVCGLHRPSCSLVIVLCDGPSGWPVAEA